MADYSSSDESHTGEWKTPRVIIIGAGIAGVAAANELYNAGIKDFVILEATERIGGRIWSVDLENVNGRKAELGANWIHAIDQNPIYKLCMKHKLLPNNCMQAQTKQFGNKVMYRNQDGEIVNLKTVLDVDWVYGTLMTCCEDFYQEIKTCQENDSVGAFVWNSFQAKVAKYGEPERAIREMIFQQRMRAETVISGSNSMSDISLHEAGSYHEIPGDHYVIPPGFQAVMDLLSRDIPKEKVLLNHQVTQISWDGDKTRRQTAGEFDVCVECQNGSKFYANHIINTIPLGYLKKHAKGLFTPRLPDFKLTAIERVAMGVVNKVILEFEGPVFTEGIIRLELMWNVQDIENEDMKHKWFKKITNFDAIAENVLVGWTTGAEAEYMETLKEEDVGNKCVEVLQQFLQRSNLPPLKKCTTTRWKSNPYTLGSYCFIPVGARAQHIVNLAEPLRNTQDKYTLLWAGEATHPNYYSSSHGAFLTGEREATRIINMYPQPAH